MMKKFFTKHSTVIMVLMLILSVLIGSTAATYILNTEKRNNIFLFGNVNIQLIEEDWNDLSKDDKILSPGKTVKKDPQVRNTGECSAYIFLKIAVPKCEKIRVVNSEEEIINLPQNELDNSKGVELFDYDINDNWESISASEENADYNEYIYGYKTIVQPGEVTEKLFNEVTFLNIVEGEIEQGEDLNIVVEAIAVQSDFLEIDENASLEEIYKMTIK